MDAEPSVGGELDRIVAEFDGRLTRLEMRVVSLVRTVERLQQQQGLGPEVDEVPLASVEPTLTVERAGRLMGVSRATAYAAAKVGDLPTIRVNGRLVVPTAAIRKLLALDDV